MDWNQPMPQLGGATANEPFQFNGPAWVDACKLKWIRQLDQFGCGVACMAMATGRTYEEARAAFDRLGLDKKRGARNKYSSNFKELSGALSAMGRQVQMRRWSGWTRIDGVGILKVKSESKDGKRSKTDWHWVVAERTEAFGVVVLDPAMNLPAFERPPLDVYMRLLEDFEPHGSWLDLGLM